jgi:hypothetical protein
MGRHLVAILRRNRPNIQSRGKCQDLWIFNGYASGHAASPGADTAVPVDNWQEPLSGPRYGAGFTASALPPPSRTGSATAS